MQVYILALNLFPKLPPIVQATMLVCITVIGSVALWLGNTEAFNAIILNSLLVHGGLITQGMYELKQIGQGKILQGVPAGSQGIYMASPQDKTPSVKTDVAKET
jgi:hypothetical protein